MKNALNRKKATRIVASLALILAVSLLFAVQYGPGSAAAQSPPADSDGDGLIEVSTLAQLNAMRGDPDGDGEIPLPPPVELLPQCAEGSDCPNAEAIKEENEKREKEHALAMARQTELRAEYAAAFSFEADGSACPSNGGCRGYELTADLDFDENGDGEITGADAAYWNDGAGWDPMDYEAVFEGNGHTIKNLYIKGSASTTDVGLFGRLGAGGEVRRLGLVDADVNYYLMYIAGGSAGALVGRNEGRIVACYVTGSLNGASMGPQTRRPFYGASGRPPASSIGLLVGVNRGTIAVSHASGSVNESHSDPGLRGSVTILPGWKNAIGGLVGENLGSITTSYATGSVNYDGTGRVILGGLVGNHTQGTIIASYGASDINFSAGDAYDFVYVGSLFGYASRGSIIASYGAGFSFGTVGEPGSPGAFDLWIKAGPSSLSLVDTYILQCRLVSDPNLDQYLADRGLPLCADISTDFLKEPTGYTGPFTDWNVDIDNADGDNDPSTGGDNPWNFGGPGDFPTLNMRYLEALLIGVEDEAELVALHMATDGENWTNDDNWLSAEPIGQWQGVSTDAGGRVTGLILRDNGLSGELPALLGEMDRLEVLSLDRNNLSGEIPDQLGNLSSLTRLSLNRNNLEGPIPDSLSNLESLGILGIARNSDLSGGLPAWLGDLKYLTRISLHDTALSGPLPAELGGLSGLVRLAVQSTGLSGPLPHSLTELSALQQLYVEGTDLCAPQDSGFQGWLGGVGEKDGGKACTDRDALIALYDATAGATWTNSGNWNTSEPVGEWHGVTTDANGRVTHLELRNLSGEIPALLGGMDKLEVLALDRNSLSGSIPGELGSLDALTRLSLNRNNLVGPIPDDLSNLESLGILGIARNANLSGEIPSWLGDLESMTRISLHDTGLSGPLPAELGGLSSLERLAVQNTNLTGKLPSSFTGLTGLKQFYFDGDELCVPSSDAFQSWYDAIEDADPGEAGTKFCGGPLSVSIDDLEGDDDIINIAEESDGVTFTGTATAGIDVALSAGGNAVGSTVADADAGAWSVTVPAGNISDGDASVTATVTRDGESKEATYNFKADLTAPTLLSATLSGSSRGIRLTFSEAVDSSAGYGAFSVLVDGDEASRVSGMTQSNGDNAQVYLALADALQEGAVTLEYNPSATNDNSWRDEAGNPFPAGTYSVSR